MSAPADPTEIDIAAWPRRAAFAHFSACARPLVDACVRIDIAPLRAALAAQGRRGTMIACHHLALRLVNDAPAWRLRITGEGVRQRVWLHPRVDASTTVPLADGENFGFATLEWQSDFAAFAAAARRAIDAARSPAARFDTSADHAALVYCTTLPWLHFSAIGHPRRGDAADDSIPRIAFGRIDADGARQWMPLALQGHHGLVDGLHLGRFVAGFEAGVADAARWL